MPIYEATDPRTGVTIELEGDTPPTDADLDEIFAGLAQQPSALSLEPAGTQMQGATEPAPDRSLGQKAIGAIEAAGSLITGAIPGTLIGVPFGTIRGLGESVLSGQYGTQQGADLVERRAQQGMESLTRSPRTEAGQQYTAALGEALAPLATIPIAGGPGAGVAATLAAPAARVAGAEAANLGRRAGDVAAQAGRSVASAPGRALEAVGLREPAIPDQFAGPSGGSAATNLGDMRGNIAQSLPVPVDLTLGAETRNPMQLAFEKEQMKGELGGPLRQRAEDNITQINQNFDAMIDMTGSQLTSMGPGAIGRKVVDTLAQGYDIAKKRTNEAYKRAENSGEALLPVDISRPVSIGEGDTALTASLIDNLNSYPSGLETTKLATHAKKYAEILGIARDDGAGVLVPLPTNVKTLEKFRQEIVSATGYDKPDIRQATIFKKLIDAQVEPLAGPLYKRARELRTLQAKKYENRAIVADLLTNKRGTDDRKVAIDRVFNETVLNGSPEELSFLRGVILTSGKGGRDAWKELQGATIKHIQDEATKGMNTTSTGEAIVSPAKLHNAVQALDKNGRLDLVLGQKNASLVRDLNEVVQYVNTVPPGTLINSSGTAGTLMAAMAEAGATGALTGLPVPALSILKMLRQQVKSQKLKKKINRALNLRPSKKGPAQ
jgi:hypothetical protein